MQLQQSLFVDSGDFVAGLHEKSKHTRVYAGQIYSDPDHGDWHQWGSDYKTAIKRANNWKEYQAKDCYISANGFAWEKGTGRSVSSVTSLNCFYVDFDRYNIEQYKDLTAEDFLSTVLSDNPWLPPPTMFVDSGNGCWMFWNFKRPLKLPSDYSWLAQWQTQQDFLIRNLKEYGADSACADAARVVRCAGTVNSKTNRTAKAWSTGQSYEFKDLKIVFNGEYRKEKVCTNLQLIPDESKRVPKLKPKTKLGKVSRMFNQYTLSWARIQDYKTLARLRGGFSDNRRMAIWCYAVAASYYCKSEQTLRSELDDFIDQCIHEPHKYRKSINYEAVIDRMKQEVELIASGMPQKAARESLGYSKSRYRLTNKYVIQTLEISLKEQKRLRTIIGKEEKQDRNTKYQAKKRREEGAMPRAEYRKQVSEGVAERAREAKRLHAELGSTRAVAEIMGMGKTRIHQYLNSKH